MTMTFVYTVLIYILVFNKAFKNTTTFPFLEGKRNGCKRTRISSSLCCIRYNIIKSLNASDSKP